MKKEFVCNYCEITNKLLEYKGYEIFINSRDVPLDSFVRTPQIDVLAKMIKHALPLPKKCSKHPTKYVEFVCHTCSKCVCGICCRSVVTTVKV